MAMGALVLIAFKGRGFDCGETEEILREKVAAGALELLDGGLEGGETRETGKWSVGHSWRCGRPAARGGGGTDGRVPLASDRTKKKRRRGIAGPAGLAWWAERAKLD
jgi:hypothetical protein